MSPPTWSWLKAGIEGRKGGENRERERERKSERERERERERETESMHARAPPRFEARLRTKVSITKVPEPASLQLRQDVRLLARAPGTRAVNDDAAKNTCKTVHGL